MDESSTTVTKEDLSFELKKFLLETIKEAKVFVVKEAPDVVKEILEGKFFEAAFTLFYYFAFMGLLTAFSLLCNYHSGPIVLERDGSYYQSVEKFFNAWWYARNCGMIAMGIGTLVGIFLVPSNIILMYQIKKTPKAYLMEILRRP